MTKLQDKIAALKAGDYDALLKGTEFDDAEMLLAMVKADKYTWRMFKIAQRHAAKVIVLEEQVRVLREALAYYADAKGAWERFVPSPNYADAIVREIFADNGKVARAAIAATDMGE